MARKRRFLYAPWCACGICVFDEIAQEVGISRFYAGIHYRISITTGITLGKKSMTRRPIYN